MLGFIVGTLCLIALIKVLRWGRWGHCGHNYGYRGHGGPWGHHHGRGRHLLRYLFERLGTTPGQEKAVVAAVEELRAEVKGMRGELDGTRSELARALGGASFDAGTLRDLFARHDGAIDRIRKAAVSTLGKVHEALDERQRKELAAIVESAGRFGRFGAAC